MQYIRKKAFAIIVLLLAALFMAGSTCADEILFNRTESPFGIHFDWIRNIKEAQSIPVITRAHKELNIKNILVNLPWMIVEPSRGVYDWTIPDEIIRQYDGCDCRFIVRLTAISDWATKKSSRRVYGKYNAPGFPVHIGVYKSFLRKIVKRYQRKVTYWQIENEVYGMGEFWAGTPEEYISLLSLSYKTIKEVDPSAKVLPAGIALGAIDIDRIEQYMNSPKVRSAINFIDLLLDEGRDYFDLLDIHLYYKHDEIEKRVSYLRNKMLRNGYEKTMVATETGGPDIRAYMRNRDYNELRKLAGQNAKSNKNNIMRILEKNPMAKKIYLREYREELHRMVAGEVIKRYVSGLYSGLKKIFWLRLKAMGGPDPLWEPMSLMDTSGKPNAGYFALHTLIRKLEGIEKIRKFSPGNFSTGYDITLKEGNILVVWSDRGEDVVIETPWKKIKTTDALLKTNTHTAVNGRLKISLTSVPVFVERLPGTALSSTPAETARVTGKVSFIGVDGSTRQSFSFIDRLEKTGINYYGIEQLRWHFIEPSPPRGGVHHYNWQALDSIIRKIESADGQALVTIVCSSTWATRYRQKSRVASPPEESHWDDYRDFVRAVVERYDHDGNMDMPGLKYAHLYYQIEDEAENLSSWRGSDKEYLKLLVIAGEGARLADPNVKILTFSPNLGDFFDYLNDSQARARLKKVIETARKNPNGKIARKLRFIKTVLEEQSAYDIIALQYNYHYTGLPGILKLIREFSSKPFWIADAGSVPLLGRRQRVGAQYTGETPPYLSENDIAAILSNKQHARHEEIKHLWETEQARTAFKKIVTAAAMGAEHVFLQFILDQKSGAAPDDTIGVSPWNFSGLMENNGELRPVLYTARLFEEKLDGFQNVKDLSRREGPFYEWTYHYIFSVGRKTLHVLWSDNEKKQYPADLKGKRLSATRIIEKKANWPPEIITTTGPALQIGTSPVIVEIASGDVS